MNTQTIISVVSMTFFAFVVLAFLHGCGGTTEPDPAPVAEDAAPPSADPFACLKAICPHDAGKE